MQAVINGFRLLRKAAFRGKSPGGRRLAARTNRETPIHGSDFKRWRKSLDFSQKEAAEALGLKRRVVQYYEKGERDGKSIDIPKTVRLACFALTKGTSDYDGPEEAGHKAKKRHKDKDKDKEKKGGKSKKNKAQKVEDGAAKDKEKSKDEGEKKKVKK